MSPVDFRGSPIRLAGLLLAAATLPGCDFISGGETVISGSDNLFVEDDTNDRIAAYLAGFDTTPPVTDDELRGLYARIRRRALDDGDPDAALVLLRIAAIQRGENDDRPDWQDVVN